MINPSMIKLNVISSTMADRRTPFLTPQAREETVQGSLLDRSQTTDVIP